MAMPFSPFFTERPRDFQRLKPATTVASAAPGLDALLVQPAALPRPFTATVQPRPTVACGTTLKVVPLDGRAVGLDDGAGTTIGHVVNIHAGPPWPRPPTRNW